MSALRGFAPFVFALSLALTISTVACDDDTSGGAAGASGAGGGLAGSGGSTFSGLGRQQRGRRGRHERSGRRRQRVLYPGLPSHPQHAIAQKQMQNGFGGMLSILLRGGREKALQLCGLLNLFTHATSLGGVESLIEHRKSIESADSITPDHLLRISVGIEDSDDLIADFQQALHKI